MSLVDGQLRVYGVEHLMLASFHQRASVLSTNGCAVAKVCLVLSGVPRPRWKKAGKTIRSPSSERIEGTTACGGSDVRPSVKGRETFAS